MSKTSQVGEAENAEILQDDRMCYWMSWYYHTSIVKTGGMELETVIYTSRPNENIVVVTLNSYIKKEKKKW